MSRSFDGNVEAMRGILYKCLLKIHWKVCCVDMELP